MQVKNITDKLSVSEQIFSLDVQTLVDNGVELVINNRPDGEEASQPTSAEIEKAVLDAGLKYAYIPIVNRDIPSRAIIDFAKCIADGGKVHAFCRTGTRSSLVWAMAEASNDTADNIIALAKQADIDLSSIKAKLESLR